MAEFNTLKEYTDKYGMKLGAYRYDKEHGGNMKYVYVLKLFDNEYYGELKYKIVGVFSTFELAMSKVDTSKGGHDIETHKLQEE